jgi:multicomponent Na+:H+ antiporter subunit B
MNAATTKAGAEPTHRRAIGAVLSVGVFAVLVVALVGLPRESAPLPPVARQAAEVALPSFHSTEPVSEVVYGTRAFDTFGETFLLLAAVVSVLLLARRRERRVEHPGEEEVAEDEQRQASGDDRGEQGARMAEGDETDDDASLPADPDDVPLGQPAPERAAGMTVIVRVAARVAAPVLAVAGLYLCAWGYTPGGGFPAGAVVLGVVLLLYTAFGHERVRRATNEHLVEAVELLGALAIVGLGVTGLVVKGSLWANWVPLAPPQTIRSGGILQLFSVTELFEVATGLILVVFALLTMRHDWTDDENGNDR